MSEADIIQLVKTDAWMMKILKSVEVLNLNDWWIGAGFLRSKVWDNLHGFKSQTELPDVDVIYFNKNDFSKEDENKFSINAEEKYQKLLKEELPGIKWSVTNQARMHIFHRTKPYENSEDALSDWSETATCIGIRLIKEKLILTAPYGIKDLVNLKLRKIPDYDFKFRHDPDLFFNRIKKKKWLEKWPKLKVVV